MNASHEYLGGENFNLRDVLLRGRRLRLRERAALMGEFLDGVRERREHFLMRPIGSAADREVRVETPDGPRTMLMFGSNNYLGLATHPDVLRAVTDAVETYGAGVGGPPLFNGYTTLHARLEERLAAHKGAEAVLLFASGYAANVGLMTGIVTGADRVLYDAYSHASLTDGLKLAGATARRFGHSDLGELERMLSEGGGEGDTYVAVEGVYSMDGDTAPLDRIVPLCRRHGALVVLDDAHGLGVLGATGSGTAEHFGLKGQIDITMGTFSKSLGVVGGFVASSKPIVEYLRYFARSYMFSASLPPAIVAAVLAGLEVIEREPERIRRLHANVARALAGLRSLGIDVRTDSAIIPLRVPAGIDIRAASRRFNDAGIFLNAVEYPAVPLDEQRFRISVMATHTDADIDRLLEVVAEVWAVSVAQAA